MVRQLNLIKVKVINLKSRFIKKLFGFSMSSWITAILSYCGLIISTHLYDSYDLGIINFYISIVTILCSIFNLALDQGYLRFYPDVEECTKKRILAMGIFATIFFVSITIFALSPFQRNITNWIFGSDDRNFFLMIPICALGLIIIRFVSLPWRASGNVLKYTIFSLMYSLAMKIAYIVGILFDDSWTTALITYSIIIGVLAIVGLIFNKKEIKKPSPNEFKIYKKVIFFSLPLVPAMVMTNLNNMLPQFIIRSFLGFEQVAIFSAAVTVASAINIIQSGFNTFWAPYVYENYKSKQEEIQNIHTYVTRIMCLFATIFILLQYFVFLLFKPEYSATAQFLPFLVLAPLTYTIGETTQIGISISKKSYLSIYIYFISIICNFILCSILSNIYGLNGAAISAGMASLITLTLKTYFGNKYYRSCKDHKVMIEALVAYIIACISNMILFNNYFLKFIVVILIILWMVWRFEIIHIIRSLFHKKKGNLL